MGRNATRPTGCPVGLDYLIFPSSSFPGEKFRDHFIVRFVGAMNRNRTGTAWLTRHECCRYTTKAPKGSVRELGSGEIKNDGTEVPSFLTARISDLNQRASSPKRVPNCIQKDVGTGKQKMTAPKCRHFQLHGKSGFPDRNSPIKRVPKTYCSENP